LAAPTEGDDQTHQGKARRGTGDILRPRADAGEPEAAGDEEESGELEQEIAPVCWLLAG
jgi:hypothetical protein